MTPRRTVAAASIGVGEAWAIVTALSYTATNLLLRAAAVHIDPWLGSMLRQVPVFTLAWALVLLTRAPEAWPGAQRFLGWRFVLALAAGGFASLVIGNVLYFQAL